MQSILSSTIFFHTLIIDFILTLFVSRVKQFNVVMFVICKFIKRITIVLKKNIWSAVEWDETFLNQLDIENWSISKIIISNRNRKFMNNFWRTIFTRLKVKLLYNIVYHLQIDEQSKKINQKIEIAFRFHINTLNNFANWWIIMLRIQRDINNSSIVVTKKTLNEIFYKFTFTQSIDLLQFFVELLSQIIRMKIVDVIAFDQINFKFYYDRKHQSTNLVVDDWTQIRFHKNYNISFIVVLNNKLNQQYIVFFRVMKKIDRLTYRLNISRKWIIHSIFSIAQLKSCFSSAEDFFRRARFINSNFVYVEKNIEFVKFFELKRIINKRIIVKRNIEYLVKWKKYESEHDV